MKISTVLVQLALGITLVVAHPAFRGVLLREESGLLAAYDYVIIGAGASGLTVANRLTEDAGEWTMAPALHISC